MSDLRQDRISGYLYVLDGLRAVSLLFIVMFHTWQQSWISWNIQLNPTTKLINLELIQRYGYVAIDAFFVLSGFCLFYPVARAMFGETTFKGWKDFFIKRARRIYPSYVLMLLVMLFIPKLSYGLDMNNVNQVTKHYLSHLLFIHTWDTATLGSTISTAWTMGIEVQFYILFPLICIPFKKKPVLTFLGMLVTATLLRLYLVGTADVGKMTIQAITPAYLDVFGFGMISAYFVVYTRNKLKSIDTVKLLMTMMSVLCILLAYGYIKWLSGTHFPQGMNSDSSFRFIYRGIFAGLIAGFIYTACFSCDLWQKKLWGNRFFVFLSSISYTVYLWHQNIYIFLKNVNVPYTTANPPMNDRAAMEGLTVLCLTASIVIGWLVTKYIETPIVRYGYSGCMLKIKEFFKRNK